MCDDMHMFTSVSEFSLSLWDCAHSPKMLSIPLVYYIGIGKYVQFLGLCAHKDMCMYVCARV